MRLQSIATWNPWENHNYLITSYRTNQMDPTIINGIISSIDSNANLVLENGGSSGWKHEVFLD